MIIMVLEWTSPINQPTGSQQRPKRTAPAQTARMQPMRSRSYDQPPDLPFNSPTARQQAFLARNGLAGEGMDFYEAGYAIGTFVHARRQLAPTERQRRILVQHNLWRPELSRGEAHDLIGNLFANGQQKGKQH
jgi:hypothetical protein